MWYIVLIKFSVSDAILRFILLPHVEGRLLRVRKLSPGRMFMNGHAGPGFPPRPWEPCGPRTLTPRLSGPILPQEEPKLSEAREEWKPMPPFPEGQNKPGACATWQLPPPQEADWHQCLQLILPTHTSSTPTVRWGKGTGAEAKQSTLRPAAHSPLSEESAF